MIGIKLVGDTEYLDTLQDTALEIHLDNPLLGDAERLSPGSFTIPFNLPGGKASPKNAARLGNPDVIENVSSYQVQKADVFVNQVPYKRGTLRAKSSLGSNIIETNFLFGLSTVSEKFKTSRLRDVMNELITIDSANRLREVYVKYTGAGSETITVNGKTYTASDWDTIRIAINTDADEAMGTGQYVPYATYVATTPSSPAGIFSGPYIKIKLVRVDDVSGSPFYVDSVDPLQELIVTVPDDELNDYLFDSWDMAAYYAAFSTFLDGYTSTPYATDKIRFPTLFNANLYDGERLKSSEIINGFDAGGLIRNYPAETLGANSLQPFLRLKYVLDKIATYHGFVLEGDFYDSVGERLLDNSVTLDAPQIHLYNKKFLWWRRSFNLNELVPDITTIDFLKAICGRYNVGMYYNELNGKVRMKKREGVALAYAHEDIDSLAGVVEGGEDLRITGYTVRIPKETSDAFSTEESITEGTPQNTYVITCGRLHQTYSMVSGGFTTGPRVSRKNNDAFGLRIFHYLGIADNGVNEYPQADIHGSGTYEALSDFVSLQGIHTTYHKYWLLFERNRLLVKLKVNWPLRSLLQFDWELKRRFNRSLFLVKSFKVNITTGSMSVSEVELITMR